MGDLLTSVPMRPGILRRYAPIVTDDGRRGIVWDPEINEYGRISCGIEGDFAPVASACLLPGDMHLDLTEPLGRAVGWVWVDGAGVIAEGDAADRIGMDPTERYALLSLAMRQRDMTPAQVDRFTRLILAVQP